MDIDAKDIKVFMYKILRFSMNTCYIFVQKHPLVSGVLFISFMLYLFLPSVFYFLIYSSPVLVCTVVYIRFYLLNSKCPKIQNPIKDEKKDHEASSLKSKSHADGLVVNKNNKASIRSQLSVRRNISERYKEWDANGGKDENDMVMSKTPNYDDLIARITQIEEKPKIVIEENESYDHGESSSCNVSAAENIQALDEHRPILVSEPSLLDLVSCEKPEKFSGGEVDVESLEEDEDEEEAHEDRNNAVEWTADDQKNLMDLGDSEIERNKRLESLIAKRRARKLFKTQIEKVIMSLDSVPPSQIAPIFIARSSPFQFPNNSDNIDSLQMPGSAPSIMLPARNPFDLPYEPHEEKPNLLADSFQQEFAASHQKDMFFCRHESFCRGPSFPLEPKQDRNDSKLGPYSGIENRTVERPQFSRFSRQSGKSNLDQPVEVSSRESEPISNIEQAPDVVGQGDQARNVMNSVEFKHDEDRKTGNSMIEIKGEGMGNDSDVKSRSDNGSEGQMETDSIKDNNSESSSSSFLEDRGQNFNGKGASVSENVQPRVDILPQELSTPVCSIPKNVHDKTKMEERSFYTDKGACHTPTYSIASDMQVEVSELSESSSSSFLEDRGQIFNGKGAAVSENVQPWVDIFPQELSTPVCSIPKNVNDKTKMEERSFYTDKGACHTPTYSIASDMQVEVSEFSSPPMTYDGTVSSPDGESLTYDGDVEKELTSGSEEMWEASFNSRSREINEVSEDDSIEGGFSGVNKKPEDPMASSMLSEQVAEKIDVNSSEYKEGNSEKPAENQAILESKEPTEENKNSNFIEGFKGNPEKTTENEDIEDVSKPIQGEDNLKSIPDGTDEQNIAEVGVSGINQSSDDPVASSVHPELMVEQVPVISSSSASGVSGVNQSSDDPVASSVLPELMVEQVPLTSSSSSSGVSGVNQSTDDPVASSAQPELIVEQVPIVSSSSSSPRSVLQLERFPSDQISPLNFDQQRGIDMPQTSVEDTVRNNQSDEQRPQNLSPTIHQNAQHLVEDSSNYPANNSNSEKLEEPSNTLGKSTEEVNIIYNMSELLSDDKKGEEDLSTKPSEGESEISREAALELSKQAEESNPRSLQHSKAENLVEYEASIGLSKPEEKNANSDVPGTMVKAEELTNSPGKVTEEASIINKINIDPVFSEKEDEERSKSVQGSGSESQFSIRHEATVEPLNPAEVTVSQVKENIENRHSGQLTEDEAIINPPKSIEENERSSTIKDHEEFGELVEHDDINHPPKSADAEGNSDAILDVKSEHENLMNHEAIVILPNSTVEINQIDIPGTVVAGEEPSSKPLPQKSTAEVDIIHSVNGAVANEMTGEKNYVGDSDGEPQTSNRQDAIVEPSKTTETTTSRSIKDTEGEPKKLIEDEANISPSGLARESNTSNYMKNSEEPGMLIDQETVTYPPKLGGGNDSLKVNEDITEDDNGMDKLTNHEMVVEPSKPIESQVKATNPEANNSHLEAA